VSAERELLERLQEALASADVQVDDLVEAAWAEARIEVQATLRRLFTHDLLGRVLASLEGSAPAPPPRPGPDPAPAPAQDAPVPAQGLVPPTASERVATYLFGIVATGSRLPDPDGRPVPGGGPLRSVEVGRVEAVVCDVDPTTFDGLAEAGPDGLEVLAATAYAHDGLLAELAASTTVLPLRLGTVLPDDGTVRTLLADSEPTLVAELERLAGRAEWAVTVRLLDAPEEVPPTSDVGAPSGQDYLRQRQRERQARDERWRLRQELAESVHRQLAAAASDATTVGSRPIEDATPPLLHGVYLLDADQVPGFEAAVDGLRAAHPAAVLEVSGPWPPYHFSRVELGAGGAVSP
jgi:hypothetical protein